MSRNRQHFLRLIKSASDPLPSTANNVRTMPAHVAANPASAQKWNAAAKTLSTPSAAPGASWGDYAEELANPTTGAYRDNWSKHAPWGVKPLVWGAGAVADMAAAIPRGIASLGYSGASNIAKGMEQWNGDSQASSQAFYDNLKNDKLRGAMLRQEGFSGDGLNKAVGAGHEAFMNRERDRGSWDDNRSTVGQGAGKVWSALADESGTDAEGRDNSKRLWSGIGDIVNTAGLRGVGNMAMGTGQLVAGAASGLPAGALAAASTRAGAVGTAIGTRLAGNVGGRLVGGVAKTVPSVFGVMPRSNAWRVYDDVVNPAVSELTGRDISLPGLARGAFWDHTLGTQVGTVADNTPEAIAKANPYLMAGEQASPDTPPSPGGSKMDLSTLTELLAAAVPGAASLAAAYGRGSNQQEPGQYTYDNSALGRAGQG